MENVLIILAANPLNVPLIPSVLIILTSIWSMFHLRNKTKGLRVGLGFLAAVVGKGSVSGKAWSRVLTVSSGYTKLLSVLITVK